MNSHSALLFHDIDVMIFFEIIFDSRGSDISNFTQSDQKIAPYHLVVS